MFSIELQGVDALAQKFERFSLQLEDAKQELPQELTLWQREDMHRKFPNTQSGRIGEDTVATTSIWPTSRAATQKDRRRMRAKRSGPRQYAAGGRSVRSNRPILRHSLYDKLVQRMTLLLAKATKWP